MPHSTTASQDRLWQERFEQVQAFHAEHGRWPTRTDDAVLREWLKTQRAVVRSGSVRPDRAAHLQAVGLLEVARRPPTMRPAEGRHQGPSHDERWRTRWEEVQAYWLRAGRLPSQDVGTAHTRSLGRWISKQRAQHREGRLPPERERELQEWGLKLRPRPTATSNSWDGLNLWDEFLRAPDLDTITEFDASPGTGLDAGAEPAWVPPAQLPPQEQWRTEEAIRCLECGRWLKALGKHLPAHGLDSNAYRAAWQMKRGQALTCEATSAQRVDIAVRTGGTERMRQWAPIIGQSARAQAHEIVRSEGFRQQARDAIEPAAAAGRRTVQEARLHAAMAHLIDAGYDPDRWLIDRLTRDAWTLARVARHLDITDAQLQAWRQRLRIPSRAPGPRRASTRPGGTYRAGGTEVPVRTPDRRPQARNETADEAWTERLQQVQDWQERTGHWPSAGAGGTPQEQTLGRWLKQQRHKLRRNTLPAHRTDPLGRVLEQAQAAHDTQAARAAQPAWTGDRSTAAGSTPATQRTRPRRRRVAAATSQANIVRWHAHLEQVRAYQRATGHLPRRSDPAPGVAFLGRWLARQTHARAYAALDVGQRRLIDDITGSVTTKVTAESTPLSGDPTG